MSINDLRTEAINKIAEAGDWEKERLLILQYMTKAYQLGKTINQ